jgi:hypothetical protein
MLIGLAVKVSAVVDLPQLWRWAAQCIAEEDGNPG